MSLSQYASRRASAIPFPKGLSNSIVVPRSATSLCYASTIARDSDEKSQKEPSNSTTKPQASQQSKKKTQAELDRELQLKMQGLAGDGGVAGVELEDGQPVSMKRSVRNNMFRYI